MPRRKGGKQVRPRRSRTNSFNGISTLQIVGESVVWRALKSHCGCLHCAQRPAVADSFTSTQLADYQRAGETQILSVDTLKSPCRGLCWCPVHRLSCLKKEITFKETDIKLSYLVPAHTCQDRPQFGSVLDVGPCLVLNSGGRKIVLSAAVVHTYMGIFLKTHFFSSLNGGGCFSSVLENNSLFIMNMVTKWLS